MADKEGCGRHGMHLQAGLDGGLLNNEYDPNIWLNKKIGAFIFLTITELCAISY